MTRAVKPRPLPARRTDSHKGDYGRVLLVAGSRSMPGAAVLAAHGALRGGAGLVTVATPRSAQPMIAPGAPCATYLPLSESRDGALGTPAKARILAAAARAGAVVLGPGLGSESATFRLARDLIVALGPPLVLDADGLNAAAGEPELLRRRSGPTVLTPHPGELSRLDGRAAPRGAKERRERAESAAKRFKAVVCLKGHQTVVTDGERTYVNDTGNPGMATGGTGDVLAGLVGALLCQLDDPFDAAALGVRVHGLAGDLAAVRHGAVSLIASDLPEFLGEAFRRARAGR